MKIVKAFGLLAAALLIGNAASAQFARTPGYTGSSYKNKDDKNKGAFFQRLSIGYGLHFTYNALTTTYQYSNSLQTTYLTGMKSTGSTYLYLGSFFNVAKVASKSSVAIDVAVSYTGFKFKQDSVTVQSYNKDSLRFYNMRFAEQFPVSIIAIPISIDFRTGGEATLSRENRTSFAIGAGLAPSFVNAETNDGSKMKVMPFMKVEAGFFAGMEFKLRAMAFLGEANYLDNKLAGTSDVVGVTSRKSEGPMGVNVALAIMPFSTKWARAF
ncbi:MAG: hypothetical protein EOP51_12795 [Sphingobacteriales bacterium]|nr:MAG: hypothetical protein EOP51_12795 [Sphingobacteriales bacterium]